MTRDACAYCSRPVLDGQGERIGVVRFCDDRCRTDWLSIPRHSRRTYARPAPRRSA